MIKTSTVTIGGNQYRRTYSNAGVMIEGGGMAYSEAIDPPDSPNAYTETDIPINNDAREDDADMRAALGLLGVDPMEG